MKKELMEPKYDHLKVEAGKYDEWLKNGYFNSGDISKKPYTIVIPPPNVTGKLHIGHAWDNTLQDILIRLKRMQGYDVLYLPGMDHAGIATQAKVDAKLKEQGTNRYELGREKFLEVAWEWKKEYAEYIHKQWAALGISVDYRLERFTLDDGLQNAVAKVFIDLYNEGLIYRGERIINWDIQAKTALSNIEVEYKDIEGAFYHFIYPFVDGNGGMTIATTRPETMFGDVALMVHPNDKRYQQYIGKEVYIPGTNRKIPVISDEYVDMEFGTGVVKVTPAHDPNDFEVGNRHNLPRIICMNEDGTMNSLAGKYEGIDRFECRKQVVEELQKANLCPKIEKMVHSVGHSERTGVIVEPRLSKQWFVKMAPLAKDVLDMQESEGRINFIPERFNKTLTGWLDLDTIQDWCISRQLWWGHRIPAWYRGDEVYIGVTSPGKDWVQDEDVLDTWFSSALWPFATLNWPNTDDEIYKRYFPTDCLVTGYDIIFFWVARMAFQSRHFTGQAPFKNCFIHGLIRDEKGRKMSKSLGNGVDPFDLIEKYGCDAMRYFLSTNATPGQDLRFSDEKMASSWNYINKLWNISRYIQMNLVNNQYNDEPINDNDLLSIDKWILNQLNKVIDIANYNFDKYELGEAAKAIYNFVWDDLASNYLELTKVTLNGDNQKLKINTCAVLRHVLTAVIKLLHPFMPFVTEEIYQNFYDGSIMVSSWPEKFVFKNFDENEISSCCTLFDIIRIVRNIRANYNVGMSKAISLKLEIDDEKLIDFLNNHLIYLLKFVNYDNIEIASKIDKQGSMVTVFSAGSIIIPNDDLVNYEEELNRLNSLENKLTNEVSRCMNMLNNPNFISRAPAQKVEDEKRKLADYEKQLSEVKTLKEGLIANQHE